MAYHSTDNLRLEIEIPTTGLPNIVQNPSGEFGTWGWVTPVANTTLEAFSSSLMFVTNVSQAAHFKTESLPAIAGRYYAARLDLAAFVAPSGHKVRMRWEFEDTNKTLISTGAQSSDMINGGTYYLAAMQAPVGAAYVRLRVDVYNGSGGNPSALAAVTFRKAMVTHAATLGGIGTTRTNLMTNPSFETNTAGWTPNYSTNARTTAQAFVGSASLANTKTAGNNAWITSPTVSVVGGLDYAVSLYTRAATTSRNRNVLVDWYNGSGVNFTTTGGLIGPSTSAAWNRIGAAITAPTAAATMSLRVYYDTSPAIGEVHYLDGVMVEQSSTVNSFIEGSQTFGSFDYVDPVAWQNIIGPSTSIEILHETFNVGTMTAKIDDVLLDPAVADTIRPGKRIRARVYTEENTWRYLFNGKVSKAEVDYEAHKTVGTPVSTKIDVSALDAMSDLANYGEARGVQHISELPYLLEGKGVPWSVNGSGSQIASATVISNNDNASILDQVAVTRDTEHGHAYMDNNGVLVIGSGTSPDWNVISFTDNAADDPSFYRGYTDIKVDWSSEDCINQVLVKWLRYDIGADTTTEVTYGPYNNAASIAEWSVRQATFTIHGAVESETAIATFANEVLTANAEPVVNPRSLAFRVRAGDNSLIHAAGTEPTKDVEVILNGEHYFPRIKSVRHIINPETWDVALEFSQENSVAAPTYVPSPPFQGVNYDTGWVDVTFQNGWSNYGGVYQTVQYRRVGSKVILRGLAMGGTIAAAIFTLPAGFRPLKRNIVAGVVNTSTFTSGAASTGTAHTHSIANRDVAYRINIDDNGTVALATPSGVTHANGYVSLSGIEFYLD